MSAEPTQKENGIDDGVDNQIYACLNLTEPKSFFLYAGAGSGKTRSLVNAIDRVRKEYRRQLLLKGQRIAVITYTNAACDEIKKRLEFDPLVEVSTIHSFAWSLIGGYDTDIRDWLRVNLAAEISELQTAAAKGRPGTQTAIDRDRLIASKQRRLIHIETAQHFIYSPSGDNKGRDSLNHSEVIAITSNFLATKPVLAKVLVSRFPILFIDESQDTNKHLMDAFLVVQNAHNERFCLGLFGDTMQRIYSDGKVRLAESIPDNWAKPAKKMNHRCPKRVIRLINRIRSAADTHVQVGRSDKPEGVVRLFVLPNAMLNVSDQEFDIAKSMAIAADDTDWISENGGYKTLILEHQMAARRMGFEAMFVSLYKSGRLKTSLIDGDLAGLRLFGNDVLPLITAMRRDDSFEVAEIVRRRSPLLNEKLLASLGTDQLAQLTKAKAGADALVHLWDDGANPTFQDVLNSIAESKLFMIPDALLGFTGEDHVDHGAVADTPVEDEDELTEQEKELAAWREFLVTPFDQISAYMQYVTGTSKFGTHQGVKGLQFPRVMVVISDDEAKGFLFSYEKLFGAKAKSTTDIKHESTGEETTIDRTRRLFYVTCSRAESSLAIVAYSQDPAAVKRQVLQEGWFEESEVITL
ncbi:MAG: UvrD-helicase domain-containing protein [Undibacterium sp.]|nr:UvrD-helicase domain-containing protein [Undibacterium sp.]